DATDVQAPIAPRAFPAAVEIHLEVAGREARALVDVGVPVAYVETARVAVVDAALQRRLAERLVDAAEPVAAVDPEVSGQRMRRLRRGRRSLRQRERWRSCGCRDCDCDERLAHWSSPSE